MKIMIFVLLSFLFVSCANTETDYKSRKENDYYGHREIKVEDNRYILSYVHAGSLRFTAYLYFYKRAIELAEMENANYFWPHRLSNTEYDLYKDKMLKKPVV